jgi:hypothetical protein
MDVIGRLVGRLISESWQLLEWALGNWAVTLFILVALIYWAGQQRRTLRQHP